MLLQMRTDNSGINFEQIRSVAAKSELTEADIAQLTHFVTSDRADLAKTTYWANSIIQPNSWERRTYRWSRVDSQFKELYTKAKSEDSDK